MKKTVFFILLLLIPGLIGKAQQRDLIRLSCGVAGSRSMPYLTMFDADLGYDFAFSRHFGLSLGGGLFNYYRKEEANYGHDEEKHQLVSLVIGLKYTPLNLERHQLSFNLSAGPGLLSEFNRKILYYDTGPYYVDNLSQDPIVLLHELAFQENGHPKTVLIPVASLAIDYLAFITDHLGIGVSAKTTYFGIYSLHVKFAWRL